MSIKEDKISFDDESCFQELIDDSKFLEQEKKKIVSKKNTK